MDIGPDYPSYIKYPRWKGHPLPGYIGSHLELPNSYSTTFITLTVQGTSKDFDLRWPPIEDLLDWILLRLKSQVDGLTFCRYEGLLHGSWGGEQIWCMLCQQ